MPRHTIDRRTSIAAMAALAAAPLAARAAERPPAVRIAGVGSGYGRPYGTQIIGVARHGRFIENELRASGVPVEWQFPDRTGPAINEAFAANQLDFAGYGQLPQIIARAGGLSTRIVAALGVNDIYVVVRTDVRARTLADLRGLRVAVQRGTILHQSLDRFLAENRLSERDVQLYDLSTADQVSALTTGQVDAVVGVASILTLRDRGIARVLYTTRGKVTPDGFGSLLVTDDFSRRYPETTAAVVRAYVKAAQWIALDKNRARVIDIWAQSGTPKRVLIEDTAGMPLKNANNPLIDDFFVTSYKIGVAFALQQRLIRAPVDVDAWIDRSYLNDALHALDLASFWPSRPALAVE